MRDATLERWEKVTHISIAFAWVVAAFFGIAGYATFRALSQGKSVILYPISCCKWNSINVLNFNDLFILIKIIN